MPLSLDSNVDVLFLTIDSLRPDFLGSNGRSPTPTPFLDDLFADGITLESCFSAGRPTQFAFPPIMSSTLPLDHGGYEFGVRDRPAVLSEVFSERNYQSAAFVTAFWLSELYGYDRGFDTFRPLVDLALWLNNIRNVYVGNVASQVKNNNRSMSDAIDSIEPVIGAFIHSQATCCEDRLAERRHEHTDPTHLSPGIHGGWDLESATRLAKQTRAAYRDDPRTFVRELIQNHPDERFVEEMFELRVGSDHPVPRNLQVRLYLSVLRSAAGTYLSTVAREKSLTSTLRTVWHWLRWDHQGSIASAEYVCENLSCWWERQTGSRFAWAHLNDVHFRNLFSWEFGDREQLETELRDHRTHLEKINVAEGYTGSPRYDIAARYVDRVVERFINRLHAGTGTHPLVAVAADHGAHVVPIRTGDDVSQFYDEFYRIPVTFYHPELPSETYSELVSSIDIAPTLLDLLGMEIPCGFAGRSVRDLPENGREFVIAEDLGRGPCDPHSKPARLCVRSKTHKLICTAEIMNGSGLTVEEAYDLRADPQERHPIADEAVDAECDTLITEAKKRLTETRWSFQSSGK